MAGSNKVFTTLGSSNHAMDDRAPLDYYATDPKAVEMLLTLETFAPVIREETEQQKRVNALIYVLKYIIRAAGFELLNRIEIKDSKTGREYR